MRIQEAIKKAIEEDRYITMRWTKGKMKIKPEMYILTIDIKERDEKCY